MTKQCSTCFHWNSDATSRLGTCRYSPPRCQILLVGSVKPELRAIWPLTSANDRCGAWNNQSLRLAAPTRSAAARASQPSDRGGAADVA